MKNEKPVDGRDPVMVAVEAIHASERQIFDEISGVIGSNAAKVSSVAICDPCGYSGSIEKFRQGKSMACPGCGMACETAQISGA